MKKGTARRRTDLFLVRVWTHPGQEGVEELVWRGRVQRVEDGMARPFDSEQGLMEVLRSMLSGGERGTSSEGSKT